ncbi:MAG: glycosyltransferase family 4 protein [Pseudonocardia sp.]
MCSFLRSTMPAVLRRCPGVRLRVIGRHAGQALRTLAAGFGPAVALEGYVDDLDAVLSRSSAVIAPLRFGSGVKIKVLEALARGVPLIATERAAEGIPVRPRGADGCLVEDDLTTWPELIGGLVDPERNARLSTAAADFFDRTYGTEVVTAQYDKIFELAPAR